MSWINEPVRHIVLFDSSLPLKEAISMERISKLRFLTKSEVIGRLAYSKSTLHLRIKNGLMTPPVSLGGRKVGWPEHEVEQVIAATIKAQNSDEIAECVTKLITERDSLSPTA